MRTLFIIPLVLMSLVSLPSWGADFDKGLTAYNNGDFATALKEWKPLAEQGNAAAQFDLGMMYDDGNGVPQDYNEAVRLYRLAAEQGIAQAQYNLGGMYGIGKGVVQDFIYAHMWWNIAASNGYNETAKESKELLERMMTPSQIVEAQRLARECVKKNYKGC